MQYRKCAEDGADRFINFVFSFDLEIYNFSMTFSVTKLCFTKPWRQRCQRSSRFLVSNLLRQAFVASTLTGNNSCSHRISKARSQQNRLLPRCRKKAPRFASPPPSSSPPPIILKNLGKMVISSFPSAVDQEQVAPTSHLEDTNRKKKYPLQQAFSKWQPAVVMG